MRVLYVNQTGQMSGAERSLMSLLAGLGDEVEPVVACPDGELATAVEAAGIRREPIAGTQASFRLHPLHTARGLLELGRSALGVRRLVARLRPDLVHANTTRAGLLALLGRKRGGPPVLVHIRDWFPDGRFPRAVHGLIARRADAIVANSAYVAAQFDDLSPRHPVRVVHNPVELDRFDPATAHGAAVRHELGLGESDPVLSVVAQLTPWKGQDDAIRALAKLPGEPVLLLAGSAKFAGAGTQYDNVAYERELHELAAQLGVTDRVRFLGERSDVAAVLAATDVLLLPSWREAFGRIAVEAMAMAVPVVATNEGGPAEIVREGVDGLLIPPRDPDLWARELSRLMADAALREPMGRSARERSHDFSLPNHVAAVRSIYRELAGTR
jgi:glycosyltransferase involved in cell wall biosynthesis